KAGLAEMARRTLRLAINQQREMSLNRSGDIGVQLLAFAAQQRAVGGVLNQGMLEGIDCLGRRAPAEDQFGVNELVQSPLNLSHWQRRRGGDQCIGELAADRGTGLGP